MSPLSRTRARRTGFSAAGAARPARRVVGPSNRVPRVYTPAHVLFVCAASQPEASQPRFPRCQRGKQPLDRPRFHADNAFVSPRETIPGALSCRVKEKPP
ncbi:hypothetical protein ALC60_08969 [Trachymyrmex zeteki]|uniref:Uncharacterized protein n=1 Tax=Mycetomoellerius zeteki TaxID=64791 RepID=A0A151WVW1_9HYME|nr:hypothetical protein ALC60_08969 [Trachymyrmex zeteki]